MKKQADTKRNANNSNCYAFGRASSLFIRLLVLMMFLFALVSYTLADEGTLREIRESNLGYKRQVYQQIKNFIEKNPSFYRIDEQYFKLAELSTDLYINEPEVPLGYYRKVLELNPNYPNKDLILYNIGFFSSEMAKRSRDNRRREFIERQFRLERREPIDRWVGDFRLSEQSMKDAIDAFREILLNYPNSKFYSESLYRLASIFYEVGLDADEPIRYYERAKALFHNLADREDDAFQHLGLYQRAWTYYSTNQFESAIKDFAKILNVVDEQTLHKAYFEEDALNNIAFSLNSLDDYRASSVSAVYVQDSLTVLVKDKNHILDIIGRVAGIKLDINVPFQAVDYYNTFLALYPLNQNNPNIVDSIATIYAMYNYLLPVGQDWNELVLTQKMAIIDNYHSESDWYLANAENNIDKQLDTIRGAFRFMQGRVLNRYVNERSYETLADYEDFVRKYDIYPAFTDSTDFLWVKSRQREIVAGYEELATANGTIEAYYKAWQQYAYFNDRYKDHAEYVLFESDRYFFFDIFYRSLVAEQPEDSLYLVASLEKSFTLDELNDEFLRETARYLEIFTSEEYYSDRYQEGITKALYSRSLISLARNEQLAAERDLMTILEYEVDESLKRDIFIHLAQINEGFNNYAMAEQYYISASEYAVDENERKQIVNNSRAQIERMASAFFADSSYVDAAGEYLRLAEELRQTDRDMYLGYKREAVDALIKAGQYQSAIDVLMSLTEALTGMEESFALYQRSWNIADTLMADTDLVRSLQDEYIALHPSSNRAYQVRNQIIAALIDNNATKYAAAEKFFQLHEEAVANRIDIGEDKPEDIYFYAISLWADTLAVDFDDDYLIKRMLAFEKTYPRDERANNLLEIVWDKYDKQGMQEEKDELAKYIFRKDPDSQLYVNVAKRELGKLYSQAEKQLNEEKFEEMLATITQFEQMHQRYRNENMALDLDDAYLDFGDWKRYHNQLLAYDKFIADTKRDLDRIESNFISKTPADLFRVAAATELQEHVVPRLETFAGTIGTQITEISKVLEKVRAFEPESVKPIPLEIDTRAIYLMGKTYDHAIVVIDTQLDRFLSVSQQMRDFREYDREAFDGFVQATMTPLKQSYINAFKSQGAAFYNNLWQLSTNNDYNDDYTELAMARLSEWGLLTEALSLYSSTDWLAVRTDKMIENIESFDWSSVKISKTYPDINSIIGMENTRAVPIWLEVALGQGVGLPDSQDEAPDTLIVAEVREPTYFFKKLVVDGQVVEAFLKFAAYDKSSIWINGEEVASDLIVYIDDDGGDIATYAQTVAIDNSVFQEGENTILIKSEAKSEHPGILFNLDLVISK